MDACNEWLKNKTRMEQEVEHGENKKEEEMKHDTGVSRLGSWQRAKHSGAKGSTFRLSGSQVAEGAPGKDAPLESTATLEISESPAKLMKSKDI